MASKPARKPRRPTLRLSPPPLPDPVESVHQERLVYWCALNLGRLPDLATLYAVPNGGLRDRRVAAALQRQGVRPGVSDLVLPVARGGYFGLYLELKRRRSGVSSAEQTKWISLMRDRGYRALVAWGEDAARAEIEWYLGLPPTIPAGATLPGPDTRKDPKP